jgi:hypothetical protein
VVVGEEFAAAARPSDEFLQRITRFLHSAAWARAEVTRRFLFFWPVHNPCSLESRRGERSA